MESQQLIETMPPEIYRSRRRSVELGQRPGGKPLTPWQRGHAMLKGSAEPHDPVLDYRTWVKPCNLDKSPSVGGTLTGVKGQYLIFDTGVNNTRKYGGYQLPLTHF